MPHLWAIADLHLSLSTPSKSMEVFGSDWKDYTALIEKHWRECVHPEDLVLLPGDISWAMKLEKMEADLQWLESLPGKKILIRGNHDYWWSSMAKMKKFFPPSIEPLHQNAYLWEGIAIGGSRLWDVPGLTFEAITSYAPKPLRDDQKREQEKILAKEVERLEKSLQEMSQTASKRVAMLHYPPIDPTCRPTVISQILKQYRVDTVVFGHLHNLKPGIEAYNQNVEGIRYLLVASDYLKFKPKLIYKTDLP